MAFGLLIHYFSPICANFPRVNIGMGIVTIAYIWGGRASYPHYIFIAAVQVICLMLIIAFAWMWPSG